jgi:hypothetical protein
MDIRLSHPSFVIEADGGAAGPPVARQRVQHARHDRDQLYRAGPNAGGEFIVEPLVE